MFDKDVFLKESKGYFISKVGDLVDEAKLHSKAYPDFVDVLGDTIEYFYTQYKLNGQLEDIHSSSEFLPIELEYAYEFDEDSFNDALGGIDFIESYSEALAYFTLNHLFIQSYESELDAYIDQLA